MALISCKECNEKISNQADPCPRCGVRNPSMPYQLERLLEEVKALEEEEGRQQALYEKYYKQIDSFPWVLFRWRKNKNLEKKVNEHVALARQAQYWAQKKREEVYDFRINQIQE